jgi:serine/threonine protein kinase
VSDTVTRLNTALEGRYRVERELGEGGMATVYLADDLRHHRKVALKVLKPDLAAALGADRFLAEIRTTANLQHPHILPLFDSGEANGLLFYTMPYVEGETLGQRLDREGKLAVRAAIEIATDVLEALHAAHERGVVHRDIKPSNILLSSGKALLADFGIAQAAAHSSSTRLTQTGSSIGTAGYMSPEQASGDTEIDQRSDIYSLGCVLFEMLTGEPPFKGQSGMQLLTKQLTAPAPSARALRPEMPPDLDQALTTALAKEPAERFQDAAVFASAISMTSVTVAPASEPARKTIVVLPFVNRSPDPDNEYFSDGLTDEVISDLSGVSELRVISRNTAMALKGTGKDTPTLARELGVTHLVTGTVRRAGAALRVTAELVDASTDSPIWSEKLSGTMEDVFGIQEEISRQIVSALRVKLTDTEEREVSERPIDDPVAYDCYLRAYQTMYDWTPAAQQRSLGLVDEALQIVGDSALLLAMKGQLHWNKANTNFGPADEALAQAAELVDRALAVDPESYLAIFVRGLVAGGRGQPLAALSDLYRAHEMRPGDTNVLVEMVRYSNTMGMQHHWKHIEDSLKSDPLSPLSHVLATDYCWLNGPHGAAAPHARRALELTPQANMLHAAHAWIIGESGFVEEGVEIAAWAERSLTDKIGRALAQFIKCALAGDEAGSRLAKMPRMEEADGNEAFSRMMAGACARLGRREDALQWLHAAVRRGFTHHPDLSRAAVFHDMRDEPAFQELLADVKPRWEAVVEWESGRD